MNQREKILAGAVLLLVAAWFGSSWYGNYQDALAAKRIAVQDAQARLADVNLALAEGRSAVQRLEAWQDRSLPNNRERALSLYKAWLLAKAKEAGLSVDDIKPTPRTTTSAAYSTIGYHIEATGPLSAVTAMLYEFYRSPQLQQITHLRLNRPVGESPIRVTLTVEALSLPGAVATDSLPEGESPRLKLASLEAYQKSLGDRDLVNVYAPAKSEATADKPPAKTDDSQPHFSGTVGGGKGLQAWINFPATGETHYLSAGDSLKVGNVEGRILSIEPRALVWQGGEKKLRVALGQSLSDGQEIEPDAAATSEAPLSERRGSPPPG